MYSVARNVIVDRNKKVVIAGQEKEVPEELRDLLFDFMDNNGDGGELDTEELAAGRRSLDSILDRK